MNISVVIPVYNGAAHLQELVARLGVVLPSITGEFEVILVNDGSRDHSWETISYLAQEYSWILGIDLARNYGQHNALLAGIRAAHYDVIVTMDDDLQHPPEEIPALLEKLGACDLVYGIPRIRQHNLGRVISSRLMRVALSALGDAHSSHRSSYRAFRAQLRDSFGQDHNSRVVIDTLLSMGAPRIASISVGHDERRIGNSNYSFLKLASLAITILARLAFRRLMIARVSDFGIAPPAAGQPPYVVRKMTERKPGER